MSLRYWFTLPIVVLIATTAMASGMGGVSLFSPLFVLAAEPARAKGEHPNLSFGSEMILRNCWSREDLAGRPEDKIIVQTTNLLPRPPNIIAPLGDLCPSQQAPPNSIRRVIPAGNEKVVALTFDLCERADDVVGYDYEIVNYLRGHRVQATFFAGGKWMQSHPGKTMQLMADPLFEPMEICGLWEAKNCSSRSSSPRPSIGSCVKNWRLGRVPGEPGRGRWRKFRSSRVFSGSPTAPAATRH